MVVLWKNTLKDLCNLDIYGTHFRHSLLVVFPVFTLVDRKVPISNQYIYAHSVV